MKKKYTHKSEWAKRQQNERKRKKNELLRDLMVKKCYLNGKWGWQKMMEKNDGKIEGRKVVFGSDQNGK